MVSVIDIVVGSFLSRVAFLSWPAWLPMPLCAMTGFGVARVPLGQSSFLALVLFETPETLPQTARSMLRRLCRNSQEPMPSFQPAVAVEKLLGCPKWCLVQFFRAA